MHTTIGSDKRFNRGLLGSPWSIVLELIVLTCFARSVLAQQGAGAEVFAKHCAECHDSGAPRIPARAKLALLTSDQIVRTLESGKMRAQGAMLTADERTAVGSFLANPEARAAARPAVTTFCRTKPDIDLAAPQWNTWGGGVTNNRFQPAQQAGLTAGEVPKLHLKWAFGFPNMTTAAVQPTVVGKWVFVAGSDGRIYALDIDTGCVYWTFDSDQAVRTAVTIVRLDPAVPRYSAVFMDGGATVYSLDAATGQLQWKQQAGEGTEGGTGSPTVHAGRIYAPLTGGGEGAGGEGCCKAHGGVGALDAATGKAVWYASSLAAAPQPTRKNEQGVQQYGPSGASVWSAPTVDTKTGRIYIGTGDGHSSPAGATSDSIIALDMKTGAKAWVYQATPRDAYNSGCDRKDLKGCPEENGPDWDFGQPAALVSLKSGKRLLIAGQKSGFVYALDPDAKGREVWKVRLGVGGVLGGINWGLATDQDNAYVAVSDHLDIIERDSKLGATAGGLVALRLEDGKQVWRTNVSGCTDHQGSVQLLHPVTDASAPPDFGCSPAQSAAVTAIPGVVFSGSLDGHLRAYEASSGRVIWDFDTARAFYTANYVEARGGSIDVGGPAVVNGTVLTTSGYARWGGMPGNVLLAFSAEAAPAPR